MKKKMLAMILGMAMVSACMAGCGTKEKDGIVVGITQFAEHGSLDNCREGFVEGLKEAGFVEGENIEIVYKNSMADPGTASQIASALVSDRVDLICAIATPSAQAAYNVAMDTETPVIFTAVTDPKKAELVGEDGKPVGNISGTCDRLPVEAQLKMIREMLPEAKKIGILYTTSEANSLSAIEEYKSLVGKYGFELVTKGVTSVAEVGMAAEDLLTEVDCITNLTDNTVVSALATILDKANAAKVPVFGSEIEQVKMGCLAAEGLDYIELGKKTGAMAAKVLKGEEKASEMTFEEFAESALYMNEKTAKELNISVPKTLSERAAEVFK